MIRTARSPSPTPPSILLPLSSSSRRRFVPLCSGSETPPGHPGASPIRPIPSSNQKRLVPQLFLKSPQINNSSGEAASSCRRPLAEPTSSRHRLCRRPESPALQRHESLEHLALIFSLFAFLRAAQRPRPISPTFNLQPFTIHYSPYSMTHSRLTDHRLRLFPSPPNKVK